MKALLFLKSLASFPLGKSGLAPSSRLHVTTARGFDGKYGGRNSTIPSPNDVAASLQLKPLTKAPSWVWKVAWRGHGRMLPLLHMNDPATPQDADQSLKVLWNKAVVSIDPSSPASDDEWTFDLLPNPSRGMLRLLRPLLPRLHHANIEIRTVYLNNIIQQEMEGCASDKKIRLISLGGGYDPRGTRLLSTLDKVDEAWELDLPEVLASKQTMLERLEERRKSKGEYMRYPQLVPINLNDSSKLTQVLQEILQCDKGGSSWHTIFISEGVLIYVDDPSQVIQLCSQAVVASGESASFCFADRLANVPGGNQDAGRQELSSAGWELVAWQPKPGLARHMGIGRCG
jgi:O-methyltransferase involved in polyketide biosynthesis